MLACSGGVACEVASESFLAAHTFVVKLHMVRATHMPVWHADHTRGVWLDAGVAGVKQPDGVRGEARFRM